MRTILGKVLLGIFLVSSSGVLAQESVESEKSTQALDGIRADLVQMRFDEALVGLEAFLGQGTLPEGVRSEALILRAQAHAAYGDFDAVAKDYAEILAMRPGYVPDARLTPAKAMSRFEKIRKEMIGRVRISIVPEDAIVSVDGVELKPNEEGVVSLLVGEHTVRAERNGHDPEQQTIEVVAASETPVGFDLVPNARTIIVQSWPAGVEVTLDGRPVGVTQADPDGMNDPMIVVEDVPLGEHIFDLTKECYRSERLSDNLTVDLLDRRPKRYKTVRMTESRSRIVLRGGPANATAWIDGQAMGPITEEPILACPGSRTVAVKIGDRRVWQETVEIQESVDLQLDVRPRPNLVLLGVEGWPPTLQSFGDAFNLIDRRDLPRADDLGDERAWQSIRFPAEVDLAFAVVPSKRKGGADRWYLYSPILDRVSLIDGDPPDPAPPAWSTVVWGFDVVDSRAGGPNRVVAVRPGGAAGRAGLKIGDVVLDVGGREVAGADQTRLTLEHARAGAPLRLKWVTGKGQIRQAELSGTAGPLLVPADPTPEAALVRAAWAVLDSAVDPRDAASAMANLGLLFSQAGQPALAADIWRRVDWGDRLGVGEGTKQYYLGRALESMGREDDAIEAYRKAASTAATTFSDEGPAVAPAALDRLADLGAEPN